jgi:LPXTG-motif cell wall-anchored protein
MKKLIIVILLVLLPIKTYADNLTIDIEKFDTSIFWQPGDSRFINLSIKNNSSDLMKITKIYLVEVDNGKIYTNRQIDEFEENTLITLEMKNGDNIFDKIPMSNIMTSDEKGKNTGITTDISLSSNKEIEMTMTVKMDEMMGNDAQGVSREFKVGIEYYLNSETKGSFELPMLPTTPDDDIDIPQTPEDTPSTDSPTHPDDNEEVDLPLLPDEISGSGEEVKLPQTGGILNKLVLTILGLALILMGIYIRRKEAK